MTDARATLPNHPMHRFQGWGLVGLIAAFLAYTGWYMGPGYFGDLTRIPDYANLQSRGFYTGAEAVAAISSLTETQRLTKYLALVFDIPYMILQAIVCEALIGFGLRRMGLAATKLRWAVVLPYAFLLFDALEDTAIALTMATSSEVIGMMAGVFTAAKFAAFLPSIVVALAAMIGGLVALILRKSNVQDS